jgi:hypothetical protein
LRRGCDGPCSRTSMPLVGVSVGTSCRKSTGLHVERMNARAHALRLLARSGRALGNHELQSPAMRRALARPLGTNVIAYKLRSNALRLRRERSVHLERELNSELLAVPAGACRLQQRNAYQDEDLCVDSDVALRASEIIYASDQGAMNCSLYVANSVRVNSNLAELGEARQLPIRERLGRHAAAPCKLASCQRLGFQSSEVSAHRS